MIKTDPWQEELPFAPFRCAWIIFLIYFGPTIFTFCKFSVGISTVFTMFLALLACIGTPEQLGIKRVKGKDFLLAVGVYCLVISCAAISEPFWKIFLDSHNIEYAQQQEIADTLGSSSIIDKVLLWVSTCVFTPVVEEVLFRRIIYGWFASKNRYVAFFVTSAIFSLMHFFILGIPSLFFMGLGFQFVYLLHKNLWTAIILHSLVNTIACIAMSLKFSFEQLFG